MDRNTDGTGPQGRKFAIKMKKKHRRGPKGVVIANKGALDPESETNPEDPDVIDESKPELPAEITSALPSFRPVANTKRHRVNLWQRFWKVKASRSISR
ncbi:hypothetical protein DNTS_034388 [Danionella cerebrum]|uniref:Uncharacterized protein n=1 Tax=Danionella cerebrum TaxID=2873325 RepID=A0A553Q173_9TELE|nr:hypothetical protein DNTS_034388 [Danionella translucida]